MTVKTSISLTDQQHDFVRSLVDSGRYASASAVLQQGIDLLRQREEREAEELRAFREMIVERAKGTFLTLEEFSQRLDEDRAIWARKVGLVD